MRTTGSASNCATRARLACRYAKSEADYRPLHNHWQARGRRQRCRLSSRAPWRSRRGLEGRGRGGAVGRGRRSRRSSVSAGRRFIKSTATSTRESSDSGRERGGFLAETGLRISEAIEARHGDVEGTWLRVERRFYRGKVGLPKGRKKRSVRLSRELAQE